MSTALLKYRGWPSAVLLAAICWLLAVSAVRDKSNTFDEIAHLTAGYSYWVTNTFTLHTANGNLPQRLAALPALGRGYRFVPAHDPALLDGDIWAVGKRFFFELGNPLADMLLRSRALMGLTCPVLVLLVFCWSRSLWGVPGALVSAALTAFCPTVLANAPLVTSDAVAAIFFLLTTALLWRLLHRITPGSLCAASLGMGCLALSKMSAPLIAPVAGMLLCLRLLRRAPLTVRMFGRGRRISGRLRQAAVMACALAAAGLASVVMIWAAFGFTTEQTMPRHVWEAIAGQQEPGPRLAAWAKEKKLLPEPYLYGLAFVLVFAERRAAFLDGQYSTEGWRSFFPRTFLLKTPLPVFAAIALAVGLAIAGLRGSARGGHAGRILYRTAPLLSFLLVYCGTAIASHLNIGHRHLLPVYPALYILAGSAGLAFAAREKVKKWCVPVLLGLLAMDSALAWPNYIAYFNMVGGGPSRAYEHLVDSSLDWGQELDNLKRWLSEAGFDRPGAPPVYISYFGTASIPYLNIRAVLLPCFFDQSAERYSAEKLRAGVYCISASMLQGVFIPHAPGPVWTGDYEKNYRLLKTALERQHSYPADLSRNGFASMGQVQAFRQLQLAKLCAYLRKRKPDHHINYAILVYYLNDEEIDRALAPTEP